MDAVRAGFQEEVAPDPGVRASIGLIAVENAECQTPCLLPRCPQQPARTQRLPETPPWGQRMPGAPSLHRMAVLAPAHVLFLEYSAGCFCVVVLIRVGFHRTCLTCGKPANVAVLSSPARKEWVWGPSHPLGTSVPNRQGARPQPGPLNSPDPAVGMVGGAQASLGTTGMGATALLPWPGWSL